MTKQEYVSPFNMILLCNVDKHQNIKKYTIYIYLKFVIGDLVFTIDEYKVSVVIHTEHFYNNSGQHNKHLHILYKL